MESRIMRVFYGNDCLPYKDSARSVHYPIVGNSFVGACNIVQIRFYVRDIGGVNNVSWVAMSKLPNGKLGSQILNQIVLDTELNEYYVALDLSAYYTQYKGDVYISLNGYEGDIELEQDEDTGIYRVVEGTPYIMTTGSIKLSVNYAPQLQPGAEIDISDMQLILALIGEKANTSSTIQVVANITTEDLSSYDVGQLFYDLNDKQYYEKIALSPYYSVAEGGNGILGSKRTIVRYVLDFSTTTIQQLLSMVMGRLAIISPGLVDYFVRFEVFTNTIRITNLTTLNTWVATSSELAFSNTISSLISDTYLETLATQEWSNDSFTPYVSDDNPTNTNRVWVDTDDSEEQEPTRNVGVIEDNYESINQQNNRNINQQSDIEENYGE